MRTKAGTNLGMQPFTISSSCSLIRFSIFLHERSRVLLLHLQHARITTTTPWSLCYFQISQNTLCSYFSVFADSMQIIKAVVPTPHTLCSATATATIFLQLYVSNQHCQCHRESFGIIDVLAQ